jgi:putative hydrolase of the HAD superfamily
MKLAIFDLGNVFFKIDFSRALVFLARRSGVSPRTLGERVTVGTEFEAFERGELSERHFFAWLADQLGVDQMDVDIDTEHLIEGWNAIYGPVVRPTYRAIEKLSLHMPVVALTNTNATHQSAWRKLYRKELGVFNKVYVSSELGMRKPEKRIYTHVLADWGVSPAQSIFFDDLQENIDAAAEIGMATVLVDSSAVVARWAEEYISGKTVG